MRTHTAGAARTPYCPRRRRSTMSMTDRDDEEFDWHSIDQMRSGAPGREFCPSVRCYGTTMEASTCRSKVNVSDGTDSSPFLALGEAIQSCVGIS